jgi:hypothetical protein
LWTTTTAYDGEIDDGYIAPTYVPVVPPLIFAVTDLPVGGVITYVVYDLRAPVLAAGVAIAFTLVAPREGYCLYGHRLLVASTGESQVRANRRLGSG